MLKLAGEQTDGTITWMGGIDYLRDMAAPTMCKAAAEAGKPAPRFVAMVPVLLDADRAAAAETIELASKLLHGVWGLQAVLSLHTIMSGGLDHRVLDDWGRKIVHTTQAASTLVRSVLSPPGGKKSKRPGAVRPAGRLDPADRRPDPGRPGRRRASRCGCT